MRHALKIFSLSADGTVLWGTGLHLSEILLEDFIVYLRHHQWKFVGWHSLLSILEEHYTRKVLVSEITFFLKQQLECDQSYLKLYCMSLHWVRLGKTRGLQLLASSIPYSVLGWGAIWRARQCTLHTLKMEWGGGEPDKLFVCDSGRSLMSYNT